MFSVAASRWRNETVRQRGNVAPPMRPLRQDAEHQTNTEKAQGAAAPAAAEQRRLSFVSKSVSHSKLA